jgi:hypothetical protein
MNSHDVQ